MVWLVVKHMATKKPPKYINKLEQKAEDGAMNPTSTKDKRESIQDSPHSHLYHSFLSPFEPVSLSLMTSLPPIHPLIR